MLLKRTLRLLILASIVTLFMLVVLGGLVQGEDFCPSNVAQMVCDQTAEGGEVTFLVLLRDRADLSGAARIPNREGRGWFVVKRLREVALHTQADLRAALDRQGIPYRSYYIVNMLTVTGGRDLVIELASRPDVDRIEANPEVRMELPDPSVGMRPTESQAIEWNVRRVNADDVWALGYTGQGVVVAGQDTGYDWDHPALIDSYRGWNGVTATHDYNWHDAIHSGTTSCSPNHPEPCDDQNHGTHTMGTMVGDDGGSNQIGVAPGAEWIGCRNMREGWGTPTTYIECFEFFLAPYPVGGDPETEGDPDLAPHVINNSWTCPDSEGCDEFTLQSIVETVRAAGILVVASAGNDGSSCSTVRDPIAIYEAAFSVGATNSSDNIASFSSRGPVTSDGSGRMKPDVSAPGVSIRSSVPGSGYSNMQGTSMAGPHVAGVAALLWSAAPDLIGDVDATEMVIEQSARPRTTSQGCGGDGPSDVPNNVYGWGIVDALEAVEQTVPPLALTKLADGLTWPPARILEYTLTVENTAVFTVSGVTISDTVPAGVPLAGASGVYTHIGEILTWQPITLGPAQSLRVTLAVTIEGLLPGTLVVNDDYGVRAADPSFQLMGPPVETTVPYHLLLLPIYREWSG
jgi:subtilisin family serine protease